MLYTFVICRILYLCFVFVNDVAVVSKNVHTFKNDTCLEIVTA